jgi:hypothetical protein
MHPAITVSHEGRRGCGYRKTGGLYLRSDNMGVTCGRLPIPLVTCPCCGHGFAPSRQPTWVDADRLLEEAPECLTPKKCRHCPLQLLLDEGVGRSLLVWIGEAFYPTPAHFEREASVMGISRRLISIPHGFEVGETVVLLAHRKCIMVGPREIGTDQEWVPGVFRLFRPQRIEVVVTGDESDEVIDDYIKRGLTPVKVVRTDEQPSLAEALFGPAVSTSGEDDA